MIPAQFAEGIEMSRFIKGVDRQPKNTVVSALGHSRRDRSIASVDPLPLRPQTGFNLRALASVVKGQKLKGSWAGS
jgi:hypothetical protein